MLLELLWYVGRCMGQFSKKTPAPAEDFYSFEIFETSGSGNCFQYRPIYSTSDSTYRRVGATEPM